MEQGLNFRGRFVPALLQRGLANMLRNGHVRHIQLAVTDDLHFRDCRDLLADQLEDRATEIPSDALVVSRFLEPQSEKRVVKSLPARGKAVDVTHARG